MSSDTVSTLYNNHHQWLSSWLCKKVGCSYQAADLAQDTFLRIILRGQKEGALAELKEPRAYLTTVAGRLVTDFFRRQSVEQRYLELLSRLPEAEMPSPQEQLMLRETLHELDALFDRLNPAVRVVFLLSQLEGLTYTEIAKKVRVSERTVKRHMAQAFAECILAMDS